MADTYGYDEAGNKKFDPGMYDQWGVYMGQRAPDIKAAKVGPRQNSDLWSSDLPFEQWLPLYAQTKLARESESLPGVTAEQGTQEYRDQVAAQQEAARIIAGWGGTVGNMPGVHAAKGAGLNLYNQYKDNKPGQIADWARAKALQAYNKRAEFAARVNGGANAAAATPAADEGTPDMWPGTGMQGSLPAYAAPQYNPVDSWGGWSGVYGNAQNAQSNPAGMSGGVGATPASTNPLTVPPPTAPPATAATHETDPTKTQGTNTGVMGPLQTTPNTGYTGGQGLQAPASVSMGVKTPGMLKRPKKVKNTQSFGAPTTIAPLSGS